MGWGDGMAGRAITVAQQKGGAGKTTIAVNLAVAWAGQGRRVAVVDIDPQGSLTRWFAARTATLGDPGLTHVQITGWRTQREVERLLGSHDVVVIDSPPHAETEAKIAVRAASLVLVPVQPSPMDVWATEPTLALAKAEGRPMLLVLNRVPSRTRLADALAGAIEGLGVPVAATQLGNRTGYAAAMMDGLGVSEGGRNKAADEIMALAREVLG
jgi:chromosome partitioning protein